MFKSRKPGPTSSLPYWDFVTLKSGEVWRGWLAGPVVGVECHYLEGTRGCRESVTDGEVPCPWCAGSMGRQWRGYVPLWDQYGIRHVTILSSRYADLALSIEHLEPVAVSKLKKQGSPIRLEPSDWTDLAAPLKAADSRPQDLRPWLVRLWGDVVLEEWVHRNPHLETADISQPLPRSKRKKKVAAVSEPVTPDEKEAARMKELLSEKLAGSKGKKDEKPAR